MQRIGPGGSDIAHHSSPTTRHLSACNTMVREEGRQSLPTTSKEGSTMLKRAFVIVVAGLMAAWGAPALSQKEIRWGTSAVGSSGHKALVVLAELLNREMPNYRVTVQPTPGAIVTVKGYATGQFDGYYGADIAFYELAHDSNRFRGFKQSMKRQPVQSFWSFTVEVGAAVHSRDKGKFKGWADLNGKTRVHRPAAVGRARPSRACLRRARREASVPPGRSRPRRVRCSRAAASRRSSSTPTAKQRRRRGSPRPPSRPTGPPSTRAAE